MREKGKRRSAAKLDSVDSWLTGYWIPAMDRRNKHYIVSYFYSDVRRSWTGTAYITLQELTYRFTIIFLSAGIFGTGVGQIIAQLVGG